MSKLEPVQECRRNRRLSNTITTEPAQPAKLLLMRYLGLPYTLGYVPTNFRCFPSLK